jgi:hypothetical protein
MQVNADQAKPSLKFSGKEIIVFEDPQDPQVVDDA